MLMPVVTVVMSIRTLMREASQPSQKSSCADEAFCQSFLENSVIIIEYRYPIFSFTVDFVITFSDAILKSNVDIVLLYPPFCSCHKSVIQVIVHQNSHQDRSIESPSSWETRVLNTAIAPPASSSRMPSTNVVADVFSKSVTTTTRIESPNASFSVDDFFYGCHF